MYRIDNASAAAALPAPAAPGPVPNGYFTPGNPSQQIPATIVNADWLNMVQEELMSILIAAGVGPSKTEYNNILASLGILFGGGHFLGLRIFATVGTATYNPTEGVNSALAFVLGGGGASGGPQATSSVQTSAAGGGGTGAWALKRITNLAPMTITVGAGGVGVLAAPGGNGGASSVGALVSASGGGGGSIAGPTGTGASYNAAAGVGAARGSSGDLNSSGNTGYPAQVIDSEGVPLAVMPSVLGSTFGFGAAPSASPPSTAAAAGAAGGQGLVLIWEFT